MVPVFFEGQPDELIRVLYVQGEDDMSKVFDVFGPLRCHLHRGQTSSPARPGVSVFLRLLYATRHSRTLIADVCQLK